MGDFVVSEDANYDMVELWQFVAEDSVAAADHLIDDLESMFSTLARQPRMGRSRNELLLGLRSFPVSNYLVFYLEAGAGIIILRVLSGYRDLDSLFHPEK